MKNGLKLMALFSAVISAGANAEAEDRKVTLTFPDSISHCRDVNYPCQLYSEVADNDGTLFAYVKISTDPYAIVPGHIMGFRDKGYVIKSIQVADQEDFAEEIPGLISIEMKPYEEEVMPNIMYPATIGSKYAYEIVYFDPAGVLKVVLPVVVTDTVSFNVGELVYLSKSGLYKITSAYMLTKMAGVPNRVALTLELFKEVEW